MIVMHIQSSILSASFEMENVITVLPESVTKTCWKDSLHGHESSISHDSRRLQTETVGADQPERPVVNSRQSRRHRAAKKRHRRQKERAASRCQPQPEPSFACSNTASTIGFYSHQPLPQPEPSFVCSNTASTIGFYSHQWVCKKWPWTFEFPCPCLRGISMQSSSITRP